MNGMKTIILAALLAIAVVMLFPQDVAAQQQCGPYGNHCWTTATRPTGVGAGTCGFNTTVGIQECFNGTSWVASGVPDELKITPPWFETERIADITVTTASAATPLPATGNVAWVCNTGLVDVQVAVGGSSVSVTTSTGSWLRSGACGTYDLVPSAMPRYDHIAAITGTGTTTLRVETGIGYPPSGLLSVGTVKPPFVAPDGSEPALVVDIGPNSNIPLPTGATTASTQAAILGVLNDIKAQAITSCTVAPVVTSFAAATLQVKGSPGTLCRGYAVNLTGVRGYLIAYNASSVPATGALIGAKVLGCVPLQPLGTANLGGDLGDWSAFDTGIVLILSAAADCWTYSAGITGYVNGRGL